MTAPTPPPGPDRLAPPATSPSQDWARALRRSSALAHGTELSLAAVLDRLAEQHGAAPAILSAALCYSFAELAGRTRRYTRWALAEGLGPGAVVALLAPGGPDYLAAWAGVSRTGAAVALLNTRQEGRALAHSLEAAGASHLLLAPEFESAFADVAPSLAGAIEVRRMGPAGLDLPAVDDAPFAAGEAPEPGRGERALLIYTSGTTGLPKAANVSHARILTWCGWFAGLLDVRPQDRLYDCLPMHHSVGGVAAVGALLVNGGSVFVRDRFSASRFWDEVVEQRCTLFQYIGELCRFLLHAPAHPLERAHALRLACGAGMGEGVWTAFQARFAVPRILEFYAATEGSFSLYNVEGRPGSIGRAPPALAHRLPAALVRFDPEAGAPWRDGEGRCQRVRTGEAGEAIGRIGSSGPNRFEGYTCDAASEAKVLRDVFAPGDAWLRTGDLMRQDAAGFFYFVDRVGDTFRWKGENVSTAEVAAVVAGAAGVEAAGVYGVAVPGCEGRAGMAAIVADEGFDLCDLHRRLERDLPPYARPLVLRRVAALETTATYKLRTVALAQEGFDPAGIADPLFLLLDGAYRPLDPETYAALVEGRIRF